MSKVNPPNGGNPNGVSSNFFISRLSPKNSFQGVLETTQKSQGPEPKGQGPKGQTEGGGSYSGKRDVLDRLTILLQKGAPPSKIVRTALLHNPVFALLSPQRQNEMVKQLAQQVREDPVLKVRTS